MVLKDIAAAGLGPDSAGFWLILAAALAAIGLFIHAITTSRRAERLRSSLEEARVALAGMKARAGEADDLKSALAAEREARAAAEASAAAGEARLAERERALAEMKARLDAEFRAATAELLDGAHKAFLQRANETFERHRESSLVEADTRSKALDALLKPVSETLGRYEQGLAELRAEQQKARGELIGRMGDLARSANDVRLEAQKLSTALRSGAKVRGRWGEEQLRNVVELAGMAAYVDFVEQKSHDDGERRKQPDMIVNLPGGRKLAVDSKVSINAYLDAVEADNDAARTAHIARHADDLWAHVRLLSAKEYAASLADSLDFVIMFVPGENYFAAAAEARPQLFQDAFERKILVATPTTLVAMLKSASLLWRQEKTAESAAAVARMAKDLHDSLRVMSGHIGALGRALETAVGKYNETVGGFEARVLPRARRFADHELPGIDQPIETLMEIEAPTRQLRDDRIPAPDEDKSAA